MHFNIYIDDETGARLSESARRTGETRNAIIRKAVQEWLVRSEKPQWPHAILQHRGDKDMPAFEAGREHLNAEKRDPLA
jgi:predicted transcriptional regulator